MTELTSCIMKNCTLSVVKFLVVSTTLPFLFMFDKEGKPSKYITIRRNFSKPEVLFLNIYVVLRITSKAKEGKEGIEIQIQLVKSVLQPVQRRSVPHK